MVEMAHTSERKRRLSEGGAAAVGAEQQSSRRVNGVSSGTGVTTANGYEQHASGRHRDEEEQKRGEEGDGVCGVNGVHVEDEEEKTQHEDVGVDTNGGNGSGGNGSGGEEADEGDQRDDDDDDEEEEEEDVLVVLELTDFKNHPIFDDYRSIRIEGIDTASPMLQIGEYTLYGQLEETVGTNFFYDTTNKTPEGKYQYVGQTTKKIKFTIAPPEP